MSTSTDDHGLPVERQKIQATLEKHLQGEDGMQMTSAQIRNLLKGEFDQDFTPYKAQIDEMTMNILQDNMAKAKKAADSKSVKPSTSNNNDSDSSDEGIIDADQVVQKKKRTKRPKDTEEDLANTDLMSALKKRPRAAAKAASRNIKKNTRMNRVAKEGDKGRITEKTKLCYISPELAVVTGGTYMRRCDVVQKMWEYIKARDMKDPKDKRYCVCDDVLFAIFKKKRFLAFGMMKDLANHVHDPEMMGPEAVAECNVERERLMREWEAKKNNETLESTLDGSDDKESEQTKENGEEKSDDEEDDDEDED